MNFKDLSIIDFLDYISGKRNFQDMESIISEIEMLEYLEYKTSTFSRERFDVAIKDIRNYAKRIEFESYVVDDKFPDKRYFDGRFPYNIYCQIRPESKFEFGENHSLKERIGIIKVNL